MNDDLWAGGTSRHLPEPRFADRRAGGRELAHVMQQYHGTDAIVLALPRGGVIVGYEIAKELALPLDVYVVRKLGAPGQPELGIGALAPGLVYVERNIIAELGVSSGQLEQIIEAAQAEMERRLLLYRGTTVLPDLAGRTIILVDDGLATGVTATAAILSLRNLKVARLVLAVPVAASQSLATLSNMVDEAYAVENTSNLRAVGLWYGDFEQVDDEFVLRTLSDANEQLAKWRSSTV
ncbi:MAG: phosphoribosyltransferase family protein [Chloroflexota bacterium]